VILVFVYGIIAIHDIPHSIAVKRNHPHADAIEATGWVSLFMMHALWPFLWIWAYYYKPELEEKKISDIKKLESRIDEMQKQINAMALAQMNSNPAASNTVEASINQNNQEEV
ncbi:MAG: DUF3302 domain-containing protein, partial [Thiotrichaceae bacterium]|nr:DUF3302 domain-containing protein [Thiotrichaceae bacterium]